MLCVYVGDVMDVVFSVCIVMRGAVGARHSNSLPLHADNFSTKLLNKLHFNIFVDIRLRGPVHYDKSNMYRNGCNQMFNMFKSSMCQMRYLVSNNRYVILL